MLTIVFAYRGENVKYFAGRQGPPGMNGVSGNDQHLAWAKHVAVPVDSQLECSFEHVDDLLMHMGVFWYEAALNNIPVCERHGG